MRLDAVAQRALARGAASMTRSLAPGQDLALGEDRGVRVAHRRGDLGRAALVQADQRDVLLEPAEQQVAGEPLVGQRLVGGLVAPGRPSSA